MAVYTVLNNVLPKDLKTQLDAVDSGGRTLVQIIQQKDNKYTLVSKV